MKKPQIRYMKFVLRVVASNDTSHVNMGIIQETKTQWTCKVRWYHEKKPGKTFFYFKKERKVL